ncbi:DNA-binding protein, partial [Streptomyces sp. NPDC054901]
DVPVAVPALDDNTGRRGRGGPLGLEQWANTPGRRDLRALCADERLRPFLLRGLDDLNRHMSNGRTVVRLLATTEGSRSLVAEWVRGVADASRAAALPELPAAIRSLTWLPAEALALAPEEVGRAAAADLGEILARTLRGGLFDELGWPAWEEAVTELTPGNNRHHRRVVMDAWPHLIVANAAQVRVIDADSTVLTHDLRVPTGNNHVTGFHYVDGDLLVFWASYDGPVQGYWLSEPGDVLTLDSKGDYWNPRSGHVSMQLPGGGRATGAHVLHPGDTRLPEEREVISDGTSYWVWEHAQHPAEPGWAEYDPATGLTGRRSAPGFLADALSGHPRGSSLPDSVGQNWLRPVPTVEGSVLGTPVDGLLGWRAVRIPELGWHGSDNAGRSVTVPVGNRIPRHALELPGDGRPRAAATDWQTLSLIDPEGVVTASVSADHRTRTFSTGRAELPPLPYWYCLRARDPEGSAVLRAMDRDTAATLLKAAAEVTKSDEVPALVAAALPRITDPVLIGGVVDQVRTALAQRRALDLVARSLAPAEPRQPRQPVERGPADLLLDDGLDGLVGSGHYRYSEESDTVFQLLRKLAAATADTGAEAVPGRLHVDEPAVPHSALPWTGPFLERPAAVAYRSVVTGTTDAQRTALCALLAEVDALGLGSTEQSAARWRRVRVRIDRGRLNGSDGRERGRGHRHRSVLPLGGGAALGMAEPIDGKPGHREFAALLHDPTGTFTLPAPYQGFGDPTTVGDPERGAGWLAAFLREAGARGAAPWFPEAAEEFARLTGVTSTTARLVLAGLPHLDTHDRGFLPAELRTALGIKATAAGHARDDLKELGFDVRRELVAALLPADPARLWTDGPDAAAAARVWNRRVGRRTPMPDWLPTEAGKDVRSGWALHRALPALLDPAASPVLSTDVAWTVKHDHVAPVAPSDAVFDAAVLKGAITLTAWLAHRLPAGEPLRACLPPALTAVRQRLAAPELLLGIGHYIRSADFRKAAGTPTETAQGYERYGAVVLSTADATPLPALRTALLDSTGSDPYLPLLRGPEQLPSSVETALRLAHDPRFAALLADPGAPAAGAPDKDGTWWPQDPSRSVPELVAEVAETYGLGADAAALYLALLAMPDPTDRNTARWTGWKPARLKAARAELAAGDLVVTAGRSRAGRTLFLPGGWSDLDSPVLPVETWKLPMYAAAPSGRPTLGLLAPTEPAADLYRRAWARIREGDVPRFEELKVKRTATRRRR